MTTSEQLFEKFCGMNAIQYERIPTTDDETPDYAITLCGTRVIVEIKELTPNEDDKKVIQKSKTALPGECVCWGGTLGKRVRHKIESAKHQLKRLAAGKFPGVLLLYDARPYPFRIPQVRNWQEFRAWLSLIHHRHWCLAGAE
ncbi:MAG: hypothetical protein WCI03_14985 [bacterium]